MTMTKKRNRGVLLDKNKIRLEASKLKLSSCAEFKEYYLKYHDIYEADTKVAYHAWTGSNKIGRDSAQKIAECLGIADYSLLVIDDSITFVGAWQNLILNESYQDDFVNFIDHSNSDLNLVQFSQDEHKDLPKVPLNAKWHIELRGNDGDSVFIILRSDDAFFQIAPIDIYSNKFSKTKMRYPQYENLFFNKKYGSGWRQLIVVRAKYIKHSVKNDHTGYICSIDELNQFALRNMGILGNTIVVDKYEFMIVDS